MKKLDTRWQRSNPGENKENSRMLWAEADYRKRHPELPWYLIDVVPRPESLAGRTGK